MNEATQRVALEKESRSEQEQAYVAKANAAASATSGLGAATIRRRQAGPVDVQIEILFCGICHSDLHQVRNEWSGVMPTVYPVCLAMKSWAASRRSESAVAKFKPATALTHIAIQEKKDGKVVDWMEPVTDEQYAARAKAK